MLLLYEDNFESSEIFISSPLMGSKRLSIPQADEIHMKLRPICALTIIVMQFISAFFKRSSGDHNLFVLAPREAAVIVIFFRMIRAAIKIIYCHWAERRSRSFSDAMMRLGSIYLEALFFSVLSRHTPKLERISSFPTLPDLEMYIPPTPNKNY